MGGSIPESLLDTPLDFDELAKLGAPKTEGNIFKGITRSFFSI
jgi:hypothetical protein